MKYKYAIIDTSAAGIKCAEKIRSVDKTGTIAIITEESFRLYSKIFLPEYIIGKVKREQLLFKPNDFYKTYNII